jgi:O-antigen ligase
MSRERDVLVASDPHVAAQDVPATRTRTVATRPAPRARGASSGITGHIAVATVALAVACMPFLTPSGPGNAAPVDAAVALAVGTVALWLASVGGHVHLPYLWPVWALAMAGFIAAGAGPTPIQSALAVFQDLFLLLWCAAVANVCRTPFGVSIVLRTWAWTGIGWAAVLVLVGLQRSDVAREALTFGNPNLAASYFVVSLMVVLASGTPRRLVARFGACLVIFAAIVVTGSLAGLVGLGAGISCLAILTVFRRAGVVPSIAALLGLLTTIALAGWWVANSDLLARAATSENPWIRNSIGRAEESGLGRDSLYSEELELLEQGGFLGIGPGATERILSADQAPQIKEAHNDYLAVLVERGVLGLGGLLLLLGGLYVRAKAVSVGPLSPGFAEIVPVPAAIAGALVALGVNALSHEVLHFRHVWAIFGVLAALYLWGRREQAATAGIP